MNCIRQKGRTMAEYHVASGIAGIYAGTMKGSYWKDKSEVTDSAIAAVMTYMYLQMRDGETSKAYAMRMMDGTYARLKLEVANECPEWAKETLGVTE